MTLENEETPAAAGNRTDNDDDSSGTETDAVFDDIVAISERIRTALECPICLLLITDPTCRCPNGHVICYSCLTKLVSLDNAQRCPMCRSPMAHGPHVSCTAAKLSEITAWLKVTCTYRQYGCDALVPVIAVADHEAACVYMPDVRCQVSTCQWVGMIDGLFDHVNRMHPASAVRSKDNYLLVSDAKDVILNRRRSYLVETSHGLFWVVLSLESRSRIRTTVLMVYDPEGTDDCVLNTGPHGMVYRVSWTDVDGKCKTRSRARRITWSPSPLHEKVSETYTMVRCKKGSLQIVWYDRGNAYGSGNAQRAKTPTAGAIAADHLTTYHP